MILLVDAGNTRIKWGWWADGQWRGKGAVGHDAMGRLAAVFSAGAPEWTGVSCVAAQPVHDSLAAALEASGRRAYWLSAQAEGHGIRNRYADPATLGADRYAALIAAWRLGHGPCVVASVGTAITMDALTGRGEFLGGMIVPGAGLMRRALAEGTAGIAVVSGDCRDFPQRTGDAVETGIWAAASGAVEWMRARLAAREGADVGTLLSGGDAAALVGHLEFGGQIIEDLVLEGLLWVARDMGAPGA